MNVTTSKPCDQTTVRTTHKRRNQTAEKKITLLSNTPINLHITLHIFTTTRRAGTILRGRTSMQVRLKQVSLPRIHCHTGNHTSKTLHKTKKPLKIINLGLGHTFHKTAPIRVPPTTEQRPPCAGPIIRYDRQTQFVFYFWGVIFFIILRGVFEVRS